MGRKFLIFSSKFSDFRFQIFHTSNFKILRFQNFQISDFKIFRFRKISKFSEFPKVLIKSQLGLHVEITAFHNMIVELQQFRVQEQQFAFHFDDFFATDVSYVTLLRFPLKLHHIPFQHISRHFKLTANCPQRLRRPHAPAGLFLVISPAGVFLCVV